MLFPEPRPTKPTDQSGDPLTSFSGRPQNTETGVENKHKALSGGPNTKSLENELEELAKEFEHDIQEIPTYLESGARAAARFIARHRPIFTIGSIILLLLLVSIYIWALWLPPSLNFAYSQSQSCKFSPIFLPSMFSNEAGNTFTVSRPAEASLGGLELFSSRLCVSPKRLPAAMAVTKNLQVFKLPGLKLAKAVKVKTGSYPLASAVTSALVKNQPVPLQDAVQFRLQAPDQTFSYALSANGKTANCYLAGTVIRCSLTPLHLAYGTKYQFALERLFKDKNPKPVLTTSVQTIDAVSVNVSSIGAGSTVFDKPTEISLITNKPLAKVEDVTLTRTDGSQHTLIPTSFSFKDVTIVIKMPDLPRQANFNLHIGTINAVDGSGLAQSYDLPFSTSGGPKVVSINISTTGVSLQPTIILTFDQNLEPGQSTQNLAALQANSASVPASYSISGSQIIIKPTNSFPTCSNFTVKTTGNIISVYGVSSTPGYSLTARTQCYTTYSIGTSVRGRAITAYQFGSGPSMVLFIGAMEGNEQNSSNLLQQWIPAVDASPGRIPAGRTVVIIPTINPDGYAADTRLNADSIDLNRNFPSNNWSEQVTEPLANNDWTNDGGPYPLSAPESQALASFFEANHPRLTLTMHSHGGIVEANDAGDSDALGVSYANLAGYKAIPTYAIGDFFNYTTTGAFEDWANDKLGLPVLEVELQSATSSEYSRNLPALWAMAQI